jgi:hypothetical protein
MSSCAHRWPPIADLGAYLALSAGVSDGVDASGRPPIPFPFFQRPAWTPGRSSKPRISVPSTPLIRWLADTIGYDERDLCRRTGDSPQQ